MREKNCKGQRSLIFSRGGSRTLNVQVAVTFNALYQSQNGRLILAQKIPWLTIFISSCSVSKSPNSAMSFHPMVVTMRKTYCTTKTLEMIVISTWTYLPESQVFEVKPRVANLATRPTVSKSLMMLLMNRWRLTESQKEATCSETGRWENHWYQLCVKKKIFTLSIAFLEFNQEQSS